MTIVFDILHFVAAALLAVIGFGYEREEECDPVHFQPVSYTVEAAADGAMTLTSDSVVLTRNNVLLPVGERVIQASDCDSESSMITYPVL